MSELPWGATDEDLALLPLAGLLGHELAGIVGPAGGRRLACQVSSLAEARRLTGDDPTLKVYSAVGGGRRRWLCCYDRAQSLAALALGREHGYPNYPDDAVNP